ncbi:MAG: zinc ribbon domain-containing protein [Porticoccaceae bacterium]|nr:zinc ribbon domain-containing protein [Porticoccaceae bacterium]
MPIYEYNCQSCGQEHEALQKISDKQLIDCPACQQPALKKMLSAAGFRLSGSGWYETDFKDSKKKNISGESGGTDRASSSEKMATSQASTTTNNKD